ncbi:MAG TPA: hypothetical protein VNZ52_16045 [Candidatus Thermoplasmatota archaeon]|nr:hypothetical protein [Candidatus Thermoplasmatota archaeon]
MALSLKSKAILVGGVVACLALGWFGVVGFGNSVQTWTGSRSMSHSEENLEGILDPGETFVKGGVLKREDLVTYYQGKQQGYRVLGDWGDVISFEPEPREPDGARIVHRAVAWVEYDAARDAYDIPELGLKGVRRFILPGIGTWDAELGRYREVNLPVELDPATAGRHSGFITKGDYNEPVDQELWSTGQMALVRVDRIEGKVLRHIDDTDALLTGALAVGVAVAGAGGYLLLGRRLRTVRARVKLGGPACSGCGKRLADAGLAFCPACGDPIRPAEAPRR